MDTENSQTKQILITRAELIKLLLSWQQDHISAADVHTWAVQRYFPGRFDVDDEEGENSVCVVVLQTLDCLDMNLVVKEDVSALLDLLSTPYGQFELGYNRWNQYMSAIDYQGRREQLRGFPLYAPFCK